MRTLRSYQEQCLGAVRQELEKVASTLVVMATGTGKTVVMAKLAAEWGRGNVLLLAHRVELLEQARDKLGAELGYAPVIEQAQRGMDIDCLWQGGAVLVASVQTLRNDKRLDKFKDHPFDLILIDECHHAVAKSYRKICEYFLTRNPACKIIGVTATPNRSDDAALGSIFSSCAFQFPIVQAVEEGWLAPVRQEIITIENVDFSGVRITRNDLGEADFNQSDLEAVMIEEEPLHALARPILDKSAGRRVVIFTAGVAHAHLLAAVLNRERGDCAAAVDGNTETEKRKQILRDFTEGKIQFLTNFNIFTEGWDCPAASVVAMGRPTKSRLVYEQMLGRVLRPLDGVVDGYADKDDRKMAILRSDKPFALCLDFVGNTKHRLINAADVLGGNYDLAVIDRAKKNTEEADDAEDEQKQKAPADVLEQLKKARAELLLEKEQEARRHIRADVSYHAETIDAFGFGDSPSLPGVERTRGGSSDAQIAFLIKLGIARETATGFTRRQASAVIEKLKAEKCTSKQQEILKKYGENPNVNFETASAIIDEIVKNGWRPRSKEAS